MLQRMITPDRVGTVATGLARLCAILLFVSLFGSWHFFQHREGSDWVIPIGSGDSGGVLRDPLPRWPLILLPLSGVVLLVLLLVLDSWAFDPASRSGPMAVAATWFALAALVLLTATEVAQASLGLGDWTSHGMGGVHYPIGEERVAPGWGWGAALAWWAAVAGFIACLVDLGRAVLASCRRKRGQDLR